MLPENEPDLLQKEAARAYQQKRYLDAARLYRLLSAAWQAQGNPINAAEAANNCSVALLQSGDPSGALLVSKGTELVFKEAGDLQKQGLALGNQAASLEAMGRNNDALETYYQSDQVLKLSGDTENRAYVLQKISALLVRKGNYFEALSSMYTALNLLPKLTFRQRIVKALIQIPFRWLSRS
ncbi:MAG TPA: hypothetical protein VIO61_17525 [Anaerolineaceae bacterium]